MSLDANQVLIQALEDYLEEIEDVRATQGKKSGTDLVEQDDEKIDEHIEEALLYLRKGTNISLIVTVEPRRQVICDALEAYESGLKESREAYWKRVDAHPKLVRVDEAISVAQGLRREYCSGRSGLASPPVHGSVT